MLLKWSLGWVTRERGLQTMPAPETDGLIHKTVVWDFLRRDVQGEPVVAAPREIDARWLWKLSQGTGETGATVTSAATLVVDQELAINSIVWQGSLREWNALAPDGDGWLMQIVYTSTVEDLKGVDVRRRAGAAWFRSNLPAVES